MVDLELTKFGYKISNSILPKPLLDMLNAMGGKKKHQYPTRNKQTPNIQKHSSTQFNTSFVCQGIHLYSLLPSELKAKTSIIALKFVISGNVEQTKSTPLKLDQNSKALPLRIIGCTTSHPVLD